MDYEKILESLKICSEVGTSCDGCFGRGERHCIANLTKAAAIAIENLLHALDMAQRERDVVTKRMIELEQETVTNRNGLNEPLTLDELREMPIRDWVWIDVLHLKEAISSYYRKYDGYKKDEIFWCGYPGLGFRFFYEDYGKTWLAYRQKPEEGTV